MIERHGLLRFAILSVIAALVTIGLKATAYALTGSVGLLSDALESLVNLAAALVALVALSVAARPADEEHTYGHSKAEYFSSAFEGGLILLAAATIAATAGRRLLDPQPIEEPGLGLAITGVAAIINLGVARVLLAAGRRHESITLEADGHHLMADVWTSLGVIVGVAAAVLSGWHRLDAVVGIAWRSRSSAPATSWSAARCSACSIPRCPRACSTPSPASSIGMRRSGVRYHALRTRQAGAMRFISFHILVPGRWTVQRGHDLLEQIEERIRNAVPNSVVDTHLEPIEDPVSWEDTRLERPTNGGSTEAS